MMKKYVWMLCFTLLLTVLLVGCSQTASRETTADVQEQNTAIDSKADPANDTTTPIERNELPIGSSALPIENTSAPDETTADPMDADGMYMLVNGIKVELGMKYIDVKEGLGAQTAPDQELGSCDNPSFVRIVHSYPSLTVTENPDGAIWGIELSSVFAGVGDAALKGKVRLGSSLEEALAALGEPENASSIQDDCMLIYRQDGQDIYIFLDPDDHDAVRGISMTLS